MVARFSGCIFQMEGNHHGGDGVTPPRGVCPQLPARYLVIARLVLYLIIIFEQFADVSLFCARQRVVHFKVKNNSAHAQRFQTIDMVNVIFVS